MEVSKKFYFAVGPKNMIEICINPYYNQSNTFISVLQNYMRFVTAITQKGQLTLPLAIRKQLKINAYDKVEIELTDGRLVIKKLEDILDLAGTIKPKIMMPILETRKYMEEHYERF